MVGADVVRDTVWEPASTLTVCWTWGAAVYPALPAWLASMTQVPAPVKLTTTPAMEQAPAVEEASMLNVTGLPDVPPAARTV